MKTPNIGDVVTFFHQPDPDGEVFAREAEVIDLRDDGTIDLAVRVDEIVTMNKRAVSWVDGRDLDRRRGHWTQREP